MKKIPRTAIRNATEACLELGCRKAYVVLAPDLVVTATRRHKLSAKEEAHTEVLLTIGKPNYRVRRFIRYCKQAKQPFPIRGTQLEWYKGTWKTRRVK